MAFRDPMEQGEDDYAALYFHDHQADKGEIYVDGHEVRKEPEKVREKIGFLTRRYQAGSQFSPDYMFDFSGRSMGKPEKLKERKGTVYLFWDQGFCAQKDERAVNRNGAEGCNRSQPGT